MAVIAEAVPPGAESHHLRRHVGTIGLLFASIGSIIGSGWLFGALNASSTAGPAAILSWTFGAIMVVLIGLVYAELGTMFPLSGGVVRFPHMAFGSFASYTTGWITWVAAMSVAPIEVEGALQYATEWYPFTIAHTLGDGSTVHTLTEVGYAVAVIAMAAFVVVNYFGVRWFARINNVLVWWKLAIICLVVATFFMVQFHGANFTSHGFRPTGWHGVFSAIATSGIVFSYLGFRQGIELAGETDNPSRNVPIAVIGSVVLVGTIYVLLQAAFIGALDPNDLSQGWSKLPEMMTDSFGPLASVATTLGLAWLAWLLYIDAVISPADTGLIYTTVTARISYAMAKNGNAPKGLASTTTRGVPLVSLIVTFLVGLIIFLPFPSWQQLVGFITSATVLSFGSGPLVLAAMRKQIPERKRPFRLPFGHLIPFLALWSSNLIVYWSGWTVVWKLMVSVLLGMVLLVIFEFTGDERPPLDFKAGATWLIPWLVGLTLVSYLGDYQGIGVIHFDSAVPILFVFSLIIYWLAYVARLDPAMTRANIAKTEHEATAELVELGGSVH